MTDQDDRNHARTGWQRRDVLRAGLVGAGGLLAGGLGGCAIGRGDAPQEDSRPSEGLTTEREPTAFPVAVADDKRGFVDAADRPFHYIADTAWNAISRLTDESFSRLATARRDRGFTALQMSVLDFAPDRGNAYGRRPFTSTGALDQPALAGGDDYWGHLDTCLDTCEKLGLLACLVPSWYGGWGDAWRGYVTRDRAVAYGRFLGERYGGRDNIWWLLGGDNVPTAQGNDVEGVPGGLDRGPRVEETIAMGRALLEASSVTPLMSYHTARTESVEEYFGEEPWYTIAAAYSAADPVPVVAAEYARPRVRPVVLWENYYDGRTEEPILDRRALRAQAYQALLTGAAGLAYGHERVWPLLDGWTEALDAPSARDIGILAAIVNTYVPGSLTPVSTAGRAAGFVRDGYGEAGTAGLVTAALTPGDSGALAYFGEKRASVTIDTTALDPDATFTILWIDPATGEQFHVGENRSGTDLAVSWPSSWADAVLVLAR